MPSSSAASPASAGAPATQLLRCLVGLRLGRRRTQLVVEIEEREVEHHDGAGGEAEEQRLREEAKQGNVSQLHLRQAFQSSLYPWLPVQSSVVALELAAA